MALSRRDVLRFSAAATCFPVLASSRANAATPRLRITSRTLDVKGKAASVFGIVNDLGQPGLNTVLSGLFKATVTNDTSEATLLHWHGLTPPLAMDGVPMLSGPAMDAGETRNYSFANREAGTHWMHSHMGLQEQRLLAAPLVIRETATPGEDEQDHVVMLHDFTFRDPHDILSELQGGGGAHAGHAMPKDPPKTDDPHAGHKMAEGPAMLNDIVYDAMLANDRTLDDPEVVQVEPSGQVRLRIINAAAASNMWIELGNLTGQLIAVDGKSVKPIAGSRFPLAIAQRADVRVKLPSGSGAFPVLFQAEGSDLQAGIILRSRDAAISRISDRGAIQPALDLSLEAQLESLVVTREEGVSRTEMLMLTGGGADYQWGLNGKPSMHDVLFRVRQGERYEVMMHNMTSMAHPMHMHGHYFRVVAIGNRRIKGAVRDTVLVPVGETVTIQFDADNPGTWAFHCHHLYHMNSGMMGTLAYSDAA